MERERAKTELMFERMSDVIDREKAYRLVEQREEHQERLQFYRSNLWFAERKRLFHQKKKLNNERVLAAFARGLTNVGPDVDDAMAQLERANLGIPKYDGRIAILKKKILRIEQHLNRLERFFHHLRLLTPTPLRPSAPNRSNGNLPVVMESGFSILIQTVDAPKNKPEEVCSCCFEPVACSVGDACLLSCLHTYHFSCVSEWLKKDGRCPTCQQTTTSIFKFNSAAESALKITALDFTEDMGLMDQPYVIKSSIADWPTQIESKEIRPE